MWNVWKITGTCFPFHFRFIQNNWGKTAETTGNGRNIAGICGWGKLRKLPCMERFSVYRVVWLTNSQLTNHRQKSHLKWGTYFGGEGISSCKFWSPKKTNRRKRPMWWIWVKKSSCAVAREKLSLEKQKCRWKNGKTCADLCDIWGRQLWSTWQGEQQQPGPQSGGGKRSRGLTKTLLIEGRPRGRLNRVSS